MSEKLEGYDNVFRFVPPKRKKNTEKKEGLVVLFDIRQDVDFVKALSSTMSDVLGSDFIGQK